MEKNIIEITPDGKEEVIPGSEPLKKEPKKKKLKDRWSDLKKALDHEKAFLDLREDSQDEEPEQSAAPSVPDEQSPDDQGLDQGQPPQDSEQDESQDSDSDEEQPQEDPQVANSTGDGNDQELPDQEEGSQEEQPVDPQELIEALQAEGYSEPEIAYIVHGHHSPEIDETSHAKAEATTATANMEIENAKAQAEMERQLAQRSADHEHEHASKLSDHEIEHKKRMADVEYEGAKAAAPDPQLDKEHRKRMLDLEYENARSQSPDSSTDKETNKQMKQLEVEKKKLELEAKKQEIQLEMEFRKKEHELKLKQMEAQIKQQAQMKDQISKEKHKHKLVDAKKPQVKKLKKSEDGTEYFEYEDTEEELEKTEMPGDWSPVPKKQGSWTHPIHGHMEIKQDNGKTHVVHTSKAGGQTKIGSWQDGDHVEATAKEMMHRHMHSLANDEEKYGEMK